MYFSLAENIAQSFVDSWFSRCNDCSVAYALQDAILPIGERKESEKIEKGTNNEFKQIHFGQNWRTSIPDAVNETYNFLKSSRISQCESSKHGISLFYIVYRFSASKYSPFSSKKQQQNNKTQNRWLREPHN